MNRIARVIMAGVLCVGVCVNAAACQTNNQGGKKTIIVSPTPAPKSACGERTNSIRSVKLLSSRNVRRGSDGAYISLSACISTRPRPEDRWVVWGLTTTDGKNYVFANGGGQIVDQSVTGLKWHVAPLGDPGKYHQRVTVLMLLANPACRTALNGVLGDPAQHDRRVISTAYLTSHCPGYPHAFTFMVSAPPVNWT